MAKHEDINVVIGDMTAARPEVDVKKDKFPAIMKKVVEGVLSKEFAIQKSKTGLKSGFVVSGNLIFMEQDEHKGQPVVSCAVSVALAELPKGHLVPGKIEGSAKIGITKDLQGDAEFAVEKAATEAAKSAIKQIERAAGK